MEFKYVKIVVYAPVSHADKIRKVLATAGAGHIGRYDSCTFTVRGTGRFRGAKGTKPFVGQAGKLESVEEERIETICSAESLDAVLKAIKEAHPYEEPAVDVYPLLNKGQL